ncbi:MAG TPA: DUF1549 domain-containing protein [Chthoniobacteraceae bacterium]|jgi:hypothetical protein|nr:DUF1549 domain-containing protein [Chthoniobacteraceae bacterium]
MHPPPCREFPVGPFAGIASIFLCCALAACLAITAQAAEAPVRQAIDAEVRAVWAKEKITPAPKADDATFLRRVHLDLVGTIPTYEEARQFLEDADAGKRDKLIQRLLDDPRYAQQQAAVWDLTLFGRNPPNTEAVRYREPFKRWLTDKFARNEPYDGWVRDLLLAEQDGSESFYVQFNNKPEELAEAFSRIFLGTQIQCARCHDHPSADLSQKDFYGMAGFFVRLVALEQGPLEGGKPGKKYKIGEKSSGDVLFAGNAKELKPGMKGEPVKPKFLGGAPLDEPALPAGFKEPEIKTGVKSLPKPEFSRKEKLVEWATSPANPYFAKAAVNRVWAQFMGRGIVHPVDSFLDDTKGALPGVLDELTRQFIEHKFDMKWLIGELVRSETYQLAGRGAVKEALPKHFERARIRPLSAEEIMAALKTAGGDAEQKSDGVTETYFVRYFGEPVNGQGEFQGGLSEHLFLNNSDNVRAFLRRKKGNLADTIITSSEPWEQRVDRMFLSVLTRRPSESERARFTAHLTSDPKTDALVEEAIWVLVNTSEFRFNH